MLKRIFGPRRKVTGGSRTYIIENYIVRTLHVILLGRLNREDETGGAGSSHGRMYKGHYGIFKPT
jgi:hypothetical protein